MITPKLIVVYSHSAGQNVRVHELPRKGKTVWAQSWLYDRDGAKGTNVAVSASRLGTPTALVSRTGNDFWGKIADSLLEGSHVDTTYLVHDSNVSTPTGVVFVDERGDNSIVLSPCEQEIPFSQIDEAISHFVDAQYVVSGYELKQVSADYALRKARQLGKKTALNPSPVPTQRPDFSFVNLLFVNQHEATELLQVAGEGACVNSLEAAVSLHRVYGCEQIVITLGRDGYVGLDRGNTFQEKGLTVNVVDTSGAGDGFMGATLSELIRGRSLQEACTFANRYSSFAVQTEGTVPSYLTRNEIDSSNV